MLLILLPWVVLSVLSATKNILSKYTIRRWMRSICYNLWRFFCVSLHASDTENGFLRPQLQAFHWHIQLPLPPPSSLPGKRRSPGFLMGKHSAGIKHENTQISVEWQEFERRILGFLTELSLQFFSIKIASAKWSRGRTQANNESHKEPEDKGLDWFADSKDEHVLLRILWKCLLGRTGIKENKIKEVLSWPDRNFWGWPSLFRTPP